MNVARIVLAGEVPFSRVPVGMLVEMPKAARRVYEALHYLRRKGHEIDVSIGHLCEQCGVKRRCITKGLAQLEDLGVIERDKCMAFGRRIIRFLLRFAGESKKKARSRTTPVGATPVGAAADVAEPLSRPERAANMRKCMFMLGWEPKLKDSGEMGWYRVKGMRSLDLPPAIRPELKEYYNDIRGFLVEEARRAIE